MFTSFERVDRHHLLLAGSLVLVLFCLLLLYQTSSVSALPHAPISILDDDDFTTANGVVSGNGTRGNPFLISGWELNLTDKHAVRVEGTTKDFVIENLTVTGPRTGNEVYGIYLANVDVGIVRNVSFVDPDADVVHKQ